jgi:actin-related protein
VKKTVGSPSSPREGLTRRPVKKPASFRKRKDSDDDDGGVEQIEEELGITIEGKIGAKKLAKLQAKVEKRNAREIELQEREERRLRQEQLEEKRQREEDKRLQEEEIEKEKQRLEKEERDRKELEEYLALKASFAVEEEGFEEEEDDPEAASNNKLQQFITYIQEQKVVLLEDLAGHFQMKTQEVINRLQSLIQQELLVGVIDDRGKFIHINRSELESVAKFIRQRGRVSLAELVESSNSLVNLTPVQS